MAHLIKDKLALSITILRPEKLSFNILWEMVKLFRKETKQWPDFIEFTPALMERFHELMLDDRDNDCMFCEIECIIVPEYATSHNSQQVKS